MQAAEFSGLEEILKLPKEKHPKETIDKLQARRKTIADIFFDKTKPNEERMKVFDELDKINKFFGYKDIFALKEKGSGRGYHVVTIAEREANCDAFILYLHKTFPDMPVMAMVDYLPMIWSNTR